SVARQCIPALFTSTSPFRSRGGLVLPAEGRQQRGLARSGGAEQAERGRAGVDGQIDPAQHLLARVAGVQGTGDEAGGSRHEGLSRSGRTACTLTSPAGPPLRAAGPSSPPGVTAAARPPGRSGPAG